MVVRGGEIGNVCRMFQHRETQFHKNLKGVDGSMSARVVMQQQNTWRQQASAFDSNCRLQFGTQHLTIPYTVYCCGPFQIMFPLWVPENCEHHFSRRRLTLEFFLHWWSRMFLFHGLAFAFRCKMMDRRFVPSEPSCQKSFTFFSMAVQ